MFKTTTSYTRLKRRQELKWPHLKHMLIPSDYIMNRSFKRLLHHEQRLKRLHLEPEV